MPTELLYVTIGIVALIVGFAAAFLIQSGRISSVKKEKERLSAEAEALRQENLQNQKTLSEQETELRYQKALCGDLSREKAENTALIADLSERLSKAAAELAAKEQSYKDLREWIDTADERLKNSFTALSQDIMTRNSRVFLENADNKLTDFSQKLDANLKGNNEAVSGIVSPVGKELKELRDKVNELEKERAAAYTGLTGQVENLQKQNSDLKAATDLLNATLKNNAQRGRWGEEQLRRIAELAGMVEHIDFEEQEVNKDGSRPDMVIHLTGGRTVPVDSKVPMNSYMLYLDATDDESRARYLNEHVKALRGHIDTLYKKAYWQSERRSVEMVAMVVPYESGLSAAFATDREIFSYAMEKNVLLLSPMTFYAFLKSVSIGWQENAMSKNAKAIAQLGKELIARFDTFFGYFEEIDKSLDKAKAQYEKAIASYSHRLSPTFERFKALSTGMESDALPETDELPLLDDSI